MRIAIVSLCLAVLSCCLFGQVESRPASRAESKPAAGAEDPNVKTTRSGLKYVVLSPGEPGGKSPRGNDIVKMYYTGSVLGGGKFTEAQPPAMPFMVGLKDIVPGWSEGVQLMTPGAKFRLTIPPNLGFGKRAVRGIPPDSTLIIEVDLISFEDRTPSANPPFTPVDDTKLIGTASGLKYRVVKQGTGATPKTGSTVTMHGALWLSDGKLVSASYESGRPETFKVGGPAIAGWTEGIQLMKEGSTYVFVIPPSLTTGATDPTKIPPGATLVWHIDLIKVE
jgi:peptidylprolyl isomerase